MPVTNQCLTQRPIAVDRSELQELMAVGFTGKEARACLIPIETNPATAHEISKRTHRRDQ